jgi:hypothetical protein
MLFLCILDNLSTVLIALMMYTEMTPWHNEHPLWCAILVGFSVGFFYLPSNIIYWLFGWKYWVTSIEVPALVNEQTEFDPSKPIEHKQRFWTETRFNILNWFGILVNTGFCVWIGWIRGVRDWDMLVPGGAPHSLLLAILYVYLSLSGLLIISAAFLGDALRRLKN